MKSEHNVFSGTSHTHTHTHTHILSLSLSFSLLFLKKALLKSSVLSCSRFAQRSGSSLHYRPPQGSVSCGSAHRCTPGAGVLMLRALKKHKMSSLPANRHLGYKRLEPTSVSLSLSLPFSLCELPPLPIFHAEAPDTKMVLFGESLSWRWLTHPHSCEVLCEGFILLNPRHMSAYLSHAYSTPTHIHA